MHNYEPAASSTESTLPFGEAHALKILIDDSILAEYDSDLGRWWDELEGGYVYTRFDIDLMRELLVKLWGEVLTGYAVDDAFLRLTADGAKEWPRAYCGEDEKDRSIADLGPD